MNKKAGGDIRTVVFAMLGFVVILTGMTIISSNFIISSGDSQSDKYTEFNDIVNQQKNDTLDDLNIVGDSLNQNVNDEERQGIDGTIQFVTSRFEDSMLGKAFKTISLIGNSVKLFVKYTVSLGGILNVPDWIVSFIIVFLTLILLFATIFFFRGLSN